MSNAIRFWVAEDEQDYVVNLDTFLVNVAGWYKVHTFSDTATNRDYVYKSEGEVAGRDPVVIRVRGVTNFVQMDTYNTWNDDAATGTGLQPNTTLSRINHGGTDLRGLSVANKDRAVVFSYETFGSSHFRGYLGRIESYYDVGLDPYPNVTVGMTANTQDWLSSDQTRAFALDGVSRIHALYGASATVTAGAPNYRDGQFALFRPIVYYNAGGGLNEVRGRLIGVYYAASAGKFGQGAYLHLDDGIYINLIVDFNVGVFESMFCGPISDDGQYPNINFSAFSTDTSVDYTKRGFVLETPSLSGTLALWRFDTTSANGLYPDETGVFNLTPVAAPSLAVSPIQQALTLNGTTQYATVAGSTTSSGVLLGEWTCETVFMPNNVATNVSGTIVEFGRNGLLEKDNVLLSVSHAPQGAVKVFWEKSNGVRVENTTASGVILKNRWNYLGVVKRETGPTYAVDVYHCSFGNHRVPRLVTTFSGLDNATGGQDSTCAWFLGSDSTLTTKHAGRLDDTRITDRPLTQAEIEASCRRVLL